MAAVARPHADSIAELREQIAALAARVAELERAKLDVRDRAALAALLPIIGPIVGDRLFSVGELFDFAAAAGDQRLIAALAAVGSPRSVGRLLSRAAGIAVGGYRVSIIGRDREGAVLRISTAK
jgi:hypothetical protein